MPTKIEYLVDRYEGPEAGSEGQLLQLIKHLDRSRYEPSMTLLRSSEYIERNSFPCSVRVLGITRLASIRTIFRMLRHALALHQEHHRLVHCVFNDSALIAPLFLRLFGIRVVVSRRDMGFWYTPPKLAVLRVVAPFVDRYVANSEAVKRVVREREWVPDEKISVIYNGYALDAEHEDEAGAASVLTEVPDGAPIIGIVANLKPIKRIDILVTAFGSVSASHPDARLVVVGDTSSQEGAGTRAELEALARRLKLYERIIFTGRVRKPKRYIERFTVAVLCSDSEGLSNSLIEYMKAGRPIVCTDTGGNPELVQDGRNGLLVPVGDAGGLADRLLRLLSDRELARRLGEAGYEAVGSLTNARMVTEQMACYDAVLSRCMLRGPQYS